MIRVEEGADEPETGTLDAENGVVDSPEDEDEAKGAEIVTRLDPMLSWF